MLFGDKKKERILASPTQSTTDPFTASSPARESHLSLGHAWSVGKATERELTTVATILGNFRDQATKHLNKLLVFESREDSDTDALQIALTSRDQAIFLACASQSAPTAALWCSHMENAPPVYDPGRSILCVKAFTTCADETKVVGPLLLDEAIRWAKSISTRESIFVTSITWAHDHAMQMVQGNFHNLSALRGDARYTELFQLEDQSTRMGPATEWYFGRSHNILSALNHTGALSAPIRQATESDIPRIVELSQQKRLEYARYQPVFWRPAADAEQRQLGFFRLLQQERDNILLVSEGTNEALDGFIIALPRTTLPMTDPALRVPHGLHIDDYTVEHPELWDTVGRDLLAAAIKTHQDRIGTAPVINVLSGTHDRAKRKLLEGAAGMRSLFSWDVFPAGNLYPGADS